MKLFKYTDFILENNKYLNYKKEYNSLGEYVAYMLSSIDIKDVYDRALQIIGNYIQDLKSDTDIDISNMINLLDEIDQRLLVKELDREIFNISENKTVDIVEQRLSGKFSFHSFLKVITALNIPDVEVNNEKCPSDFAIYYELDSVNKDRLVTIMKRFRSLDSARNIIESLTEGRVGIYFGIKYKKKFILEYGILVNDKRNVCGEFNFTNTVLKMILDYKSKSLESFKKVMSTNDLKSLRKLMKVKSDLETFSPGYSHKKSPIKIENNTIYVSYYGAGFWKDGLLDKTDYERIKSEFNDWILMHKWKKFVVYSVKPGKFWLHFKIKIKE